MDSRFIKKKEKVSIGLELIANFNDLGNTLPDNCFYFESKTAETLSLNWN